MQFSKEILKGTAEIIVLQSLAEAEEAYGYQLIKIITKNSKEIFEFSEGTLYPLLYRLENKGYITSRLQKTDSGKTRRYYRLSSTGQKSLQNKKKELSLFSRGLEKLFRFQA